MSKQLKITPLEQWGYGWKAPIFISGPCSAESEEQVHETADRLSKHRIDLLRAGIWKPRTRPNTFEGIGSVGLKWLKDAGSKHDMPVTVEVANVKHVYEALRNGIDMLWIGARTTVNPFAVQEICDALQGVDIPVMVKNPINPDLELWLGAFERLNQAGITKLAAIHRGFSTYEKSKYRNRPKWEIPIELKRRYPELPVICDPSHICGNRDLLAEVSQTAMDIGLDGVMLESHITPDKALSDAKQQIVPEVYGELVDNLVIREGHEEDLDDAAHDHLESRRSNIDRIDKYIMELLAERMEIVREIGDYKKENNLPILQRDRWNEILESRREFGERKALSAKFVRDIWQAIHKESISHQATTMNHSEEDAQKVLDKLKEEVKIKR
jgi:3-deoxy-7-phosphoheptulonate synthase